MGPEKRGTGGRQGSTYLVVSNGSGGGVTESGCPRQGRREARQGILWGKVTYASRGKTVGKRKVRERAQGEDLDREEEECSNAPLSSPSKCSENVGERNLRSV
jgi:hypothetical protein